MSYDHRSSLLASFKKPRPTDNGSNEDPGQLLEFPAINGAKAEKGLKNGYQLGRPALLKKGGKYRVSYKGLKEQKRIPFLKDIFQTLIDIKWRYAILIFCATFLFVYFVFAVLWYILGYAHDDFNPENMNNPNWRPCVENMKTFADSFMYSVETQTTIGYGGLYPNTQCGGTLFLVYLQVTVGFLIETLLVGFILVKVARPKHRRLTLLFSDSLCVCIEDGELCLQVRVGDMRKSHLVDTTASGIFISEKVSKEGTVYPLYQNAMEFEAHGMDSRVFMMWPLVLKHRINAKSPLWNMEFDEILSNTFEIIVLLEGTIESTGEICQARTSYSSKDIQWGSRFANIVDFDIQSGLWEANFKQFNETVPTPTPKCSGRDVTNIYNGTGNLENNEGATGRSSFRRTQSHAGPLNYMLGKASHVADVARETGRGAVSFQEEPYNSQKWRLSMPSF
ncbi:G protein-activated inward rectifier potassium channel 3-like [Mizuhopecten yessoensis]|uniref:G protein-activated inward rectifier potassium channel 2 n=1 Tax=Mizuhopecten yessoensis TaxID=6573 RepID=A0A210QNE6_MIZYE|nr:G protein-activated inward rectifier potassium channel 3-like [Mizuhopecten yessoensis]OWF50263.1 G protein-activated inward rectifier potassium channel 2 [Mizuhopecten yessoensis]